MIRNRYNYLAPSVSRHQRERRTHLKQRHHNQTLQAESQQDSLSQKLAKRLSKIKFSPGHTCKDHSRSTAFERSVKILLEGGGLNRFLRGYNPLPWYTQDIYLVRVKGATGLLNVNCLSIYLIEGEKVLIVWIIFYYFSVGFLK